MKEFKKDWKIEEKATKISSIKKCVSVSIINHNTVNFSIDEQIMYYSKASKNTET